MSFRQCTTCETEFSGRADARFCSSSCRQKAYRSRRNETITAAEQAQELGRAWFFVQPETLDKVDPLTKMHLEQILRAGAENVTESLRVDRENGWRPSAQERQRVRTARDSVLRGGCNATWGIPERR